MLIVFMSFLQAMQAIRQGGSVGSELRPVRFWLLSDERNKSKLEWAYEACKDVSSCDVAPQDPNRTVIGDFRRMLFADVLVMSPSSLSYSAALIAANPGQVVYVPDCWWDGPTPKYAAKSGGTRGFPRLRQWRTLGCMDRWGREISHHK